MCDPPGQHGGGACAGAARHLVRVDQMAGDQPRRAAPYGLAWRGPFAVRPG